MRQKLTFIALIASIWLGLFSCKKDSPPPLGPGYSNPKVQYTIGNGLVDNDVNAIAIDSQGNIWVGTMGGVSKFDGTNWTHYTRTNTSNGLVCDSVWAIEIDSQGNKWFGTTGGISKFDGTTASGVFELKN